MDAFGRLLYIPNMPALQSNLLLLLSHTLCPFYVVRHKAAPLSHTQTQVVGRHCLRAYTQY